MVMDLPQFLQELREALHSHAGVPTHQPLVFLRIGRIFFFENCKKDADLFN